MKQVINIPGPRANIVDSPIPDFNDDQLLIKVVVSGSNPKDWKVPELAASDNSSIPRYEKVRDGINQGDDIAGVVEKVGKNVVEFKPGDRVAAFHEMLAPGGSYAQYAVAWSHTTFHLPKNTSFEEAATIPLAGLTAAIALYQHLRLPCPWSPASQPIPLVIYGASTAVGSFAIKLARASNVHPIIAVAGKGASYVQQFLDPSKGDAIVDHRNGPEATMHNIDIQLNAINHFKVLHALDTIASYDSTEVLCNVVTAGGQVNFVLPHSYDVSPAIASNTWVGGAHGQSDTADSRDLAFVFSRWFTRALQVGTISGHPFEVRANGLEGVEQAMKDLKANRASAVKYVFRIAETPGLADV